MEGKRRIGNLTVYLVVILLFGVLVPAGKGLGFFDPVLLAAYACLGIVFAGPAAAKAFETRPTSSGEALRWILKTALFGEALAVAMLGCGIATVYARARGVVFPPDLQLIAYALILGFTASLALASMAAWLTLRISPGAARIGLRVVYLALVVLFYLDSRRLPDMLMTGAAFCLFAAAAFTLLLKLRLAIPASQS